MTKLCRTINLLTKYCDSVAGAEHDVIFVEPKADLTKDELEEVGIYWTDEFDSFVIYV